MTDTNILNREELWQQLQDAKERLRVAEDDRRVFELENKVLRQTRTEILNEAIAAVKAETGETVDETVMEDVIRTLEQLRDSPPALMPPAPGRTLARERLGGFLATLETFHAADRVEVVTVRSALCEILAALDSDALRVPGPVERTPRHNQTPTNEGTGLEGHQGKPDADRVAGQPPGDLPATSSVSASDCICAREP